MKTLLLYLSGPQQSWGCGSKFNERDTERFPTYSGILGLVACAMGISRDDDDSLAELTKLMMSVRIDQPGDMYNDWQVAHKQKISVDKKNKFNLACHRLISETDKPATYAAHRSYVADAKFVVGLTGEDDMVERVAKAICNPKWTPYLGRKAFVPDAPLFLGLVDGDDVLAIFQSLSWQASARYVRKHKVSSVVLWVDGRLATTKKPVASYVRKDMPVSFSSRHRKYLSHALDEYIIPIEKISEVPVELHDPLAAIEACNVNDTKEG